MTTFISRAPEPAWITGLPAAIRRDVRASRRIAASTLSWSYGPAGVTPAGAGIGRAQGIGVQVLAPDVAVLAASGVLPSRVRLRSGEDVANPAGVITTRDLDGEGKGWLVRGVWRHTGCANGDARGPGLLVGWGPFEGGEPGLIEEVPGVGFYFGTTDDPGDGWYFSCSTDGGPGITRVPLGVLGAPRDDAASYYSEIHHPRGAPYITAIMRRLDTGVLVFAEQITGERQPLGSSALAEANASVGLTTGPVRDNETAIGGLLALEPA